MEMSCDGNAEDKRHARTDAQIACREASRAGLFRDPGVFFARAAYHVISESSRSVIYAAESAANAVAVAAGCETPWETWDSVARQEEVSKQSNLLRDIIGNPFRPVNADPRWITDSVLFLAQAIYADRSFDRLPILADALEEAGCADTAILGHCRQAGDHVRGCWVVDRLLGKE
jgi:hypothetical protein